MAHKSVNEVVYTCDRCRAEDRTAGELPGGWMTVSVYRQPPTQYDGLGEREDRELCPRCAGLVDRALSVP